MDFKISILKREAFKRARKQEKESERERDKQGYGYASMKRPTASLILYFCNFVATGQGRRGEEGLCVLSGLVMAPLVGLSATVQLPKIPSWRYRFWSSSCS